ncbi:MAG: cation:proton antiporter [Salaquimonas sp.]
MSGKEFLDIAIIIAMIFLIASFFVTTYRVIIGPTLPDRIVALDMLVGVVIGFIAVVGVKTGYYLYVDIAIALGLVGFLATVALARFVLERGSAHLEAEDEPKIQKGKS